VNKQEKNLSSYHPIQDFYRHQQEVLRTHQQYLAQQMEYARAFWQILQQFSHNSEGKLVDLPAGIQQNLQWFHQHQQETLKIHEQYLQGQNEQTQIALQYGFNNAGDTSPMPEILPMNPVSSANIPPVVDTPKWEPPPQNSNPTTLAITPHSPSPNSNQAFRSTSASIQGNICYAEPQTQEASSLSGIPKSVSTQKVLLEIVADKTGYPTDMLEMEMDLEADLGIDSIKKVEILGALQEKLSNLSVPAEELAEQRTLGQILQVLQPQKTERIANSSVDASMSFAPNLASAHQEILLNIVADKTGYPNDMLELNMDLEADLGIDSIKKVEILGALQEKLPELEVQAEELADRRTLGEILKTFSKDSTKKNS
jgi:acyl carrier protein